MDIHELEPQKVFHFFSEIARIPHGSGNTAALAEYCLNFARERELEAYRDDYGNVVIFKAGTRGYEQSEAIIVQGHLDMVCEKHPDCSKDMEREGIEVVVDGEYLRANGTTLGGDDGIAVAYILALLDEKEISHPPIEALLTADEETGLQGAYALDVSKLTGKRMINIDSEEEGVLTVSCAGGVRINSTVPLAYEKTTASMCAKKITVGGLLGGHSGVDIGKNRKNAAIILAEALYEIGSHAGFRMAEMASGGRTNVIPSTAEAVICMEPSETSKVDKALAEFNAWFKAACADTEPDAQVIAADTQLPEECLDTASTDIVISTLLLVPNGISSISPDIPFLVQTSSNLGSVMIQEGNLELGFLMRSNTDYGKEETLRRFSCLFAQRNGKMLAEDDYPAWEYRRTSPLRDTMVQVYEEMYGEKPQICAIHAGLECGILAEKIQGADMISIGPNMKNVHTPEERLEIASVKRCWEYLLRVLASLK
ncbi:MAG: aminoacyl-histidine dipeptidase [Lachnospiraceae bacterium]|nr:aminoacyl-histidine dipeptidase [Lachnospiraceae bacterium]